MPLPGVDAAIEAFIEALWLEDGLSANTQAAYRRDLSALATWLKPEPLDACTELQLFEYAAARPAGKATSANRRLFPCTATATRLPVVGGPLAPSE